MDGPLPRSGPFGHQRERRTQTRLRAREAEEDTASPAPRGCTRKGPNLRAMKQPFPLLLWAAGREPELGPAPRSPAPQLKIRALWRASSGALPSRSSTWAGGWTHSGSSRTCLYVHMVSPAGNPGCSPGASARQGSAAGGTTLAFAVRRVASAASRRERGVPKASPEQREQSPSPASVSQNLWTFSSHHTEESSVIATAGKREEKTSRATPKQARVPTTPVQPFSLQDSLVKA